MIGEAQFYLHYESGSKEAYITTAKCLAVLIQKVGTIGRGEYEYEKVERKGRICC